LIRLTVPTIEDDDLEAVREALVSGFLVQGRRVEAMEAEIRRVAQTEHAVVVSSGTAALHLSLIALGIGAGDLVAVPAYSFLATANVVELVGAKPIFVDIEPEAFSIDPDALERVAGRDRIAAIIPVHPFGQIADMPGIAAAAPNVPVVEDGAAALGAAQDGRPAGGLGTLGCFSFHPRKAVTTGEGGAVTTNDASLARTIRALRNHGMDPDARTPDFILPGFNYRMTDFQAALGLTQLAKLDRIVAGRRAAAARYDTQLEGTAIRPPRRGAGNDVVFQSYVALLPAGVDRDLVIRRLREEGIETQIGTYHMPLTTFFRERYGYRTGDFPTTDDVAARALTLPLHPAISADEQATVVEHLLAAL
jgi:dTDP-4-amino-4,6-dideoxygalactose transaminase